MPAMTVPSDRNYCIASILSVLTTLFLLCVAGGVGLVGRDGDPFNIIYGAVLAVGVLGALVTHRSARGMARTLFAMAASMGIVALIALALGKQNDAYSSIAEVLYANGFIALWYCLAGWLFARSARQQYTGHSD